MCMTIPMRVVAIHGGSCCCEAQGVYREARLDLLDVAVAVGGFVLVHSGYALHAMTEADARAIFEVFDEMIPAPGSIGAPAPESAGFLTFNDEKIR